MNQSSEQITTQELLTTLEQLPRNQLDQLRKTCSAVIERKYRPHRLRKPLYANLTREFNHEQTLAFFKELRRYKNADVERAFLKQFFYGLRVGEITDAILIPGKFVRVINHKDGNTTDYLPFIEGTEDLFLPLNKDKGYHPNYLAKYFRETCERLGDEYLYEYAKDRAGKNRRQFSTHTLRKTAGNLLRTTTRDPFKEAVFLRHETRALFGVTSVYMHYPIEQMRTDLNETFKPYVQTLIKKKKGK